MKGLNPLPRWPLEAFLKETVYQILITWWAKPTAGCPAVTHELDYCSPIWKCICSPWTELVMPTENSLRVAALTCMFQEEENHTCAWGIIRGSLTIFWATLCSSSPAWLFYLCCSRKQRCLSHLTSGSFQWDFSSFSPPSSPPLILTL